MDNPVEQYRDKDEHYFGNVRIHVVEMIPSQAKRILDIGCGEGSTAAYAKKVLGAEYAAGVELFPEAAEKAGKVLDKVVCGDIEQMDIPFEENYFDCIIFADILEHTSDPWAVLRKVKKYLREGGCIVASIPSIRHLTVLMKIVLDKFEYEDQGILDRTHLRFFTKHTMIRMFEESGYNVQAIKANPPMGWKYRLLKYASLGLLQPFLVYQYLIRAGK